tara:strand:+ start:497 stop:733 length:237 start_codon:yes stop_codon:yes gene_type:complete
MKDNYIKVGYLSWVLVQMICLFMFSNGIFNKINLQYFYPFYQSDITYYDITEFLFFIIVPVFVYKIIELLRPEPKEDE